MKRPLADRLLIRTVTLSLLAALGACGVDPEGTRDDANIREASQDTELGITGVCPARSALWANPTSETCPEVDLWSVSSVFPSDEAGMSGFCEYQWLGPSPPAFAGLNEHFIVQGLPGIEPDCAAVAPLGNEAEEALDSFRDTWRERTGWSSLLPPTDHQTRVAVIDNAARGYDELEVDNDGHGRGVGRAIHELAWPSGGDDEACSAQIRNHLALPHLTTDELDWVAGGRFGTRAQLAQAIDWAVSEWLSDRQTDPSTPSV